MAAATVGMALALRQISQQGLTFIGGMLADRYGLKPVLCSGLIIRATGFFMLGFATTLPVFFLALLKNAMILLHFSPYAFNAVSGAVILAAIAATQWQTLQRKLRGHA